MTKYTTCSPVLVPGPVYRSTELSNRSDFFKTYTKNHLIYFPAYQPTLQEVQVV